MNNIAVCDTCTLIQLRKGGILHCLKLLFDEVCLPKAVVLECTDSETFEMVRQLGFKVCPVNNLLPIGMGRGEREAISLVKELGNAVLITSDAKAIKKANNYGLMVFETSHIIILAKQVGLISSAKTVLDSMRNQGEGIPDRLYLKILQVTFEAST
jgi:predicted nucleic acid-binding protein